MPTRQIIVIVLDSVGIGALPDAEDYGDAGADTLGHLTEELELTIPNLASSGLGKIKELQGINSPKPSAAYGRMAEKSRGKDTTTGHWELMGIILDEPFPTYPNGFPPEVIEEFTAKIGRKVLGNKAASGTVIIEELGEEHLKTGRPIVYTSADSVFQIAAHEEVIPVEELYKYCRIARGILQGRHGVGRVIARPFIGEPGSFQRTERREDFSLEPQGTTVLDLLVKEGLEVMAVGKIDQIFAGRGITRSSHILDNMDCVDATLEFMAGGDRGLIFTNLVEFDMKYGHRNDASGYAGALEEFDARLPELLAALGEDDYLFLTADHGCDPLYRGTDHTREYVPLLVYGDKVREGANLGTRESFADLGATIADLFAIEPLPSGNSFKQELSKGVTTDDRKD
ncbi:MAG: phosphopentomutase [Halanaerobium sp.]|nr:phosphopentomutase [Halanaerobium sp.]